MTTIESPKKIPSDVGATSQLSNSWRLKLEFGDDIKYVVGVGWIAWDGKRWKADDAIAIQLCEKVTRKHFSECNIAVDACSATLKRLKNDKESTATMIDSAKEALAIAMAHYTFAKRSQSVASFRDMLSHAETFPDIRIQPDQIDSKPYLLSCNNGTIDLSTGILSESKKEDLLTKQSPVEFNNDCDVSKWNEFLLNTGCDEETVEYLRQFCGYMLTGEATQELFLFIHGPPGNGKSTFIESICACLGEELSITLDFETLCRKSTSSQKYDTARMQGVRVVRTSESDRQQRLDEGLVCRWVGGERVRGRALYENPFDFLPQFKLAMSVNGKPRINPDDQETGIWRRMICVNFSRPTLDDSKRDSSVKKFWTDPKSGAAIVLKWAASGAKDYISAGKLPQLPDLLKLTRELYRQECDIVHRFMEDCCVIDKRGFISCEELRSMFVKWHMDQGEQFVMNEQHLALRLGGDPWKATKKRKRVDGPNINVWLGIRRIESIERAEPKSSRQPKNDNSHTNDEFEDLEREAIVNNS